jgi:hypothetical protein
MNELFHRQSDAGMQETEGGCYIQLLTALDATDVDITALRADLDGELDRFANVGCGWTITVIQRFTIRIGEYRPMTVSSYIPTPKVLMAKRALINVFNQNEMCFAWAILSALHTPTYHAERVTNYRRYLNSINLTGIKLPTSINQVGRFEKNNPTLSINVYVLGKNEKEIIPKYVTKCGKRQKHNDLLLITSGDKSHYVWIKNMSALISHRSKTKHAVFVCPHCIHPFSSKKAFDNHFDDCAKHKYQAVRYLRVYARKYSDMAVMCKDRTTAFCHLRGL